MKKLVLFSFAILTVFALHAQDCQEIIAQAKKQRANGQNFAAMYTLSGCQVFGPEIVHEFADLLLSPDAKTNQQFKHFGFYETDEKGKYGLRDFDFDLYRVLQVAIDSFPNNCAIRNDVSRLWLEWLKYNPGFYDEKDIDNLRQHIEYYAHSKCPNYLSNYLIGFAHNYAGKTSQALPYLQQAVSLNESFTPALVLYSETLLKSKNAQSALVYAKKAWDKTRNGTRSQQSDAALVLGKAYDALNDNKNALQFLFTADTLKRKNFFNLLALLEFYVKTGDSRTDETINEFIGSQGRTSLHHYVDVLKIFTAYGKQQQLLAWCEKGMTTWAGRDDILKCLNFTMGMIYKQANNNETAKLHFKQAKQQGLKTESYAVTHNHPDTLKMLEEAFKMIN